MAPEGAIDRLERVVDSLEAIARMFAHAAVQMHRRSSTVTHLMAAIGTQDDASDTVAQEIVWAIGQMGHEILSARTKKGMADARRAGRRWGRPKKDVDVRRMRDLAATGMSLRHIGSLLQLSHTTVQRRLREIDK